MKSMHGVSEADGGGGSRKTAGWREGAIENDESSPAVCQGRRFVELLLI